MSTTVTLCGRRALVPHRFEVSEGFVDRLEGPERRRLIPPREVVSNMSLGGDRILLDLGAGIGYLSFPASEHVSTVLALDAEAKMLSVLSERSRSSGARRVEPLLGEITSLPLVSSSVDHVLAAFVYHELSNPRRLVDESWRVLRDGGRLTIVDLQKRETPIGPPVNERKTPAEVLRVVRRRFELRSRHETPVYYQLGFTKKTL